LTSTPHRSLYFMDPHEKELLTHVAAGMDIWTALAATSEDEQPPKSGCLTVLLVAAGILWAFFT
jgi:hypothetical protein